MPELDLRCEDIKEKNENSASSVRLANNLLEFHYKIWENVKNNLAPFIEYLLKAPYEKIFIVGSVVFGYTICSRPNENQVTTRS